KARVLARTLKDGQDSWLDLGAITSSLQTFAIRNGGSLLDVKLVWEGGKAEFYELASFHQELTEEPIQSSKGEEPAPVLEVPEFTGGVNAVEALVHELPEYTGAVATVGDQAAPTVEKPEFKGGVNAVMALVHELPEYTGPLATVGDQAAPMVEKPEFQGGVNSVMAFKHELPAYTGPLSTVGDQAAPTVEKPEFKLSLLEKTQTSGAPVQIAKEDKRLPETGEKQSETAIFLASVGLALSAIFVAKSKKEIN
ncbi:SIALI-17 repeat-containing surface protein, partial [Streptococcus oralis]|uniref:SIALI-17 repeat-containing surface protein n=1 Tax=Streptococcus oralis TaxID=1303 RepID=UPI0018C86C03